LVYTHYMVKKVVVKKELSDKHILRIAKKHFLAYGYAGARMQAIADEAGVNKALLHYYYKNKEGLFKKVFDGEAGKMLTSAEQIVTQQIPILDKLRLLIENDISQLEKNPDMPMFLMREMARDPSLIDKLGLGDREKTIIQHIAGEILLAQKKGIIREEFNLQDIFINMGALTMFPFLAKPFCKHKTGMSEKDYNKWIQERKKTVPDFIIRAISK
jgi:TetR/AcrR family transcriptional regulator